MSQALRKLTAVVAKPNHNHIYQPIARKSRHNVPVIEVTPMEEREFCPASNRGQEKRHKIGG